MATQREIRKRILSVSSTKKITNTMEMISASKMKKMQGRLMISKPYVEKLQQVIYNLNVSDESIQNEPLIKEKEDVSRVMILMISGNRGLCGGYNTNVINNTLLLYDQLTEEGKDVLLYVIGKKASSYFKFIDVPMYNSEINLEDKVSFNSTGIIGDKLIGLYNRGEIDEVYVSYTRALSSTSFKPAIIRLLPISAEEDYRGRDKSERLDVKPPSFGFSEFLPQYIFEPNPQKIFSVILPFYTKLKFYLCMLESSFAEQFARRASMKNATDAASDMVQELTVKYNRARQAKITNEIAEIVGGASALE